ncbi:Yip1 family protein [Paludifilum halophilum]|uniref:Yip1 domain-containing protein n=1 Tax=Paludifilum halophilum TaxID=1642702 RepID=A0A235B906_9BACL|nr:Yip1 family protein [Paludifilum halophilum]OYD08479.1 hypothetical protein CHM34_06525 [Paludifilum halophilum]
MQTDPHVTNPKRREGKKPPSLSGMIVEPGRQFERIVESAPVWKPLLAVVFLSMVLSGLSGYAGIQDVSLQMDTPEGVDSGEAESWMMAMGMVGSVVAVLLVGQNP